MSQDQSSIIDTPNSHGMFMLGTTTLYLCHMPMFMKEDHRYQLTLRAHLDQPSTEAYLADKAKNPGKPYNLVNTDSDQFIVPDIANGTITSYPAWIFRDYVNDSPETQIIDNATVYIDCVVRCRHFNTDIPRPHHLTYVLFGDGKEAHIDHYIAQDPDYQHLLTLPEAPSWISVSQLQAGVDISFVGMRSTPIPCENPLTEDTYKVLFQGLPDTVNPLCVGASATFWFSTGNLLNAKDPCSAGEQGGMPPM